MENMKEWIRDIIVAVTLVIIGVVVGALITIHKCNEQITKLGKTIDAEYCIQDSIDEECLQLNLLENKIKFSHIVLAQAKLESNYFKSKLLKTNNNLFGMKVAATRFTFATNDHDYGNYAKYETIKDCILDYRSWQVQNTYNITNEIAYFELLSKIYAEDPNYITKLKKLIK